MAPGIFAFAAFCIPLVAAQSSLHAHMRSLHEELVPALCGPSSAWINATAYGAVGDNVTLSSGGIQAAIDAAGRVGVPACVYLSPGSYRTGTLNLTSNVHLLFDDGAVLQASHDSDDYPIDWDYWHVVQGLGCSNTGLLGLGAGTGGVTGAMWQMIASFNPSQNQLQPVQWQGVRGCIGECRPQNLFFMDAVNVTVFNIQLLDSADWTSLYRRVHNLFMDSMLIEGSRQWPNNDGMDLESCTNATIQNMVIRTGDDGIVFASGNTNTMRTPWPEPLNAYTPTAHVLVRNVSVTSYSSAIKFEAIDQVQHGDIYDVTIDGVNITRSARGIGFQLRTGNGSFHDVHVSNVVSSTIFVTGTTWWGSGEAIWVTSVPQNRSMTLSGIHNVDFTNITAVAENAVLIAARDTAAVGCVGVSNVSITGMTLSIAVLGNVSRPMHDYRPIDAGAASPPTIPANIDGIYIEHACNVSLTDVSVAFVPPAQPYWDNGVCVNATADSSYTQQGCTCTPAAGPASL